MMDIEQTIMELLVTAGSARSASLMAIQAARKNDFKQAQNLLDEAKVAINQAHKIQTNLIGIDEGEGKLKVTLIVVHAQDHLMNAMVIQDLAQDFIELFRRTSTL
ncbi:PTS lactose/cellobiose transporter subunit IIA [Photobacterium piscicola]|uniref:PTS lactose/cellobiose transporter subunit IIA n=2 Tax=Photobacterium TaxID=657 RepID=A0ABU6LGF4_9GAMM|nr:MULTISPECIES: PTS lactose/cellobiose transporter subunit IIA [Photobacterium]MEC6823240.1 PTS lactose/cellobiose transporter subunit IIA [Photobacterium piscicola]MEC6882934.1 PTS lactose/cellobiose transporter subunit IIA [Photobacterium piscicola]MEC6898181.1 PTS lactose/cellobiose transporter subunit IIA [Photobacterium piscicola]MEC6907456.1 PTS lactose/cellobiose transporter subunit IIA [Photobacterium piscicola]